MNPSSAPPCTESSVPSNGNASVCPAASKVGSGSAVINARPADPNLITAKVTAYNAVDDKGSGYPKGSPSLILYFQTSIGIKTSFFFHIVKSATRTTLIGAFGKPSKPGKAPGSFSIQNLDLNLTGSGSKRYITNPPKCRKHWPFSLTITNYFNQLSVTARAKVMCTS